NEIVPSRAKVLAGNLERLGIVNSVVTSAHPDKLCSVLDGFFDVVLVDAPCSGEGMFRRDEMAIEEWSQEHVEACALRQKAILESAQQAVKGGGALIYSTCTFSEEENERVIRWFLETYPDFELEFMHRLYPHTSKGEGHFVARLVRNFSKNTKRQASMQLRICKDKEYEKFMKEAFIKIPDAVPYLLNDGRVILLSSFMPEMLKKLRIISSGVEAGEMLSNRFAPSHSLFMAAYGCEMSKKVSFNRDDEALMRFLKGETTECDNDLKGYCAVAVDGYNIGFGKACCGIVKNHIPKGLRII
ncbi:MAG: RsmF rRNA methyltransferase first C-terminal domain-containing protein, partial [Clostridia bacterium]|nr:RsmF rRNA methyltransferase first C-terminal domain-containing protein [Clostridia bacterium]